jgi:hypothetical protein
VLSVVQQPVPVVLYPVLKPAQPLVLLVALPACCSAV